MRQGWITEDGQFYETEELARLHEKSLEVVKIVAELLEPFVDPDWSATKAAEAIVTDPRLLVALVEPGDSLP